MASEQTQELNPHPEGMLYRLLKEWILNDGGEEWGVALSNHVGLNKGVFTNQVRSKFLGLGRETSFDPASKMEKLPL